MGAISDAIYTAWTGDANSGFVDPLTTSASNNVRALCDSIEAGVGGGSSSRGKDTRYDYDLAPLGGASYAATQQPIPELPFLDFYIATSGNIDRQYLTGYAAPFVHLQEVFSSNGSCGVRNFNDLGFCHFVDTATVYTSFDAKLEAVTDITSCVGLAFGSSNFAFGAVGACFRVVDTGGIFAVSINGPLETATDTTIAVGAVHLFEIETRGASTTGGAKTRFWVDGILRATHTTHQPAADTDTKIMAEIRNTSGGGIGSAVNLWYGCPSAQLTRWV